MMGLTARYRLGGQFMDAHQLQQLDDEQYEQLITSNAHPPVRDPDIWAALTHPDNLARTRELLVAVHARTAHTLRRRKAERDEFQNECMARGYAGRQEWFESRGEYDKWRRRAANFHQCMQNAISELGKIQRDVNRSQNHRLAQGQRETLRKLAIAVQHHQAVHARAGGIADQSDYELWQLLDQLTVPIGPDQEPTTLRTMLDVYWTDVQPVDELEQSRQRAEQAMRAAPRGPHAGVPKARHVHNDKKLA